MCGVLLAHELSMLVGFRSAISQSRGGIRHSIRAVATVQCHQVASNGNAGYQGNW